VQHAGDRSSRTFGTRPEALEWERLNRNRIADRRVGRTPRYSIEEALERWLTGEARALRTLANLKNKVRTLLPHIKGRALVDVAEAAEAVKSAGLDDGLTPATINRRLAILRRVANLAYTQWMWLEEDLGRRVRLLPGEKSRHVYLTPEDVKKLAGAARDRRVADTIVLAATSGLRKGELLRLSAGDRRDGALHLPDSKNGRPRLVPLPAEAQKIRLPLQLTVDELRKGFDRARARARMPHIRFHDLRHTYASWLVQSGAPITAVRDLLGHSSLQPTGRYAHLGTADLQRAVGRIAAKSAAAGQGRGRAGRKKAA
jgi:integrase